MTDEGVVVLGVPIPSSSPLFLSIVAVHVAAGIICTVAGIVAMLAPKRSGRHPSAGNVYFWSLVVVFLSMAALSILRWPANTHLDNGPHLPLWRSLPRWAHWLLPGIVGLPTLIWAITRPPSHSKEPRPGRHLISVCPYYNQNVAPFPLHAD